MATETEGESMMLECACRSWSKRAEGRSSVSVMVSSASTFCFAGVVY